MVQRRRARERRDDLALLTVEIKAQLELGRGFLGYAHLSDADYRAAWQIHRDVILREWIAKRPGTRPFAWWHQESRRYGERRVYDRRAYDQIMRYRDNWLVRGFLHLDLEPWVVEPQWTFLRRHNLMGADEWQALIGLFDDGDDPETAYKEIMATCDRAEADSGVDEPTEDESPSVTSPDAADAPDSDDHVPLVVL